MTGGGSPKLICFLGPKVALHTNSSQPSKSSLPRSGLACLSPLSTLLLGFQGLLSHLGQRGPSVLRTHAPDSPLQPPLHLHLPPSNPGFSLCLCLTTHESQTYLTSFRKPSVISSPFPKYSGRPLQHFSLGSMHVVVPRALWP